MISQSDVVKLAELSRIAMTDAELERLQKDMESIVGYISELSTLPGMDAEALAVREDIRNRTRGDDTPHAPGVFTEKILEAAPRTEEEYIAVRQIIDK